MADFISSSFFELIEISAPFLLAAFLVFIIKIHGIILEPVIAFANCIAVPINYSGNLVPGDIGFIWYQSIKC
jgi:hypothetical protein